jgi:geranylgeranyl diphosphate synthase type II
VSNPTLENAPACEVAPPSLTALLDPYRAMTLAAISELLQRGAPRSYLYDLVHEYACRQSKALRPGLLIATCCALGGTAADALPSAAALELLHTSFLIHDDIEDGSSIRRGGPTMHAQHGVPLPLNAGDALVAQTAEMLAENQAMGAAAAWAAITEFNTALRHTTEGQALELGWRRDNRLDVRVDEYLEMILKKSSWYTVILPCRVGMVVSGGDRLRPTSFMKFGWLLGGLFQIGDDLHSLLAAEQDSGKDWADDVYRASGR